MNASILHTFASVMAAAIASTLPMDAKLALNLRFNDSSRATLRTGDPCIASVSIVDYEAQTRQSEVIAGRMELDDLRRMQAKGEVQQSQVDARASQLNLDLPETTVVGSAESPWHTRLVWQIRTASGEWTPMKWARALLVIPATQPVASIGAIDVVDAAFGFDPSVTAPISPQSYSIRVGYPLGTATVEARKGAQPVLDTIWSNTVDLTVVRAPSKGRRGTYDDERFLALYWLRRGEFARALDMAQGLLRQRPDDVSMLEIMGDALVGLGRPAEAAAAYQRGIEIYYARRPRPYEPPDLLIDKLNSISRPMLEKRE